MTEFSNSSVRPWIQFFEGILASRSFDLVDTFLDEQDWEHLVSAEKGLLSRLFLLSAEQASLHIGKSSKAAEYFHAACKLTPKDPKVWLSLGSFLGRCDDLVSIKKSIECLNISLALDDKSFDAHYAFASSMLRCGVLQDDASLLMLADAAFEKAHDVLEVERVVSSTLFLHWALARLFIAKDSGEPCDYLRALTIYRKGHEAGINSYDFYSDYAHCVIEYALLIDSLEVLRATAIPLYQGALSVAVEARDIAATHFNIACCFQHLFEETQRKEDFEQALLAFKLTEETMHQDRSRFWHKWGQLYFSASRLFLREEDARCAIECFAMAYAGGTEQNRHPPIIHALWAQSLLMLAESENELERLLEAYEHAKRAFEVENVETHHAEVYSAMALCLQALGVYFQDNKFHEDAKEMALSGIAVHPKNASLWYALAKIKSSLGLLMESESLIRESLIAFLLASSSVFSQFPRFWSDWATAFLALAEYSHDVCLAEEAIQRFEKTMDLADEIDLDMIFDLAVAYSFLAELSDEEEYAARAVFLFEELANREERDPYLLFQYALALLRFAEHSGAFEDFVKAGEVFEECLRTNLDDELLIAEYAVCLTEIGRHKALRDESMALPREWFLAEEYYAHATRAGVFSALYHSACLSSMMGNHHEALEKLYQALEVEALPPPEELLEDEWLSSHLLHTPQFRDFFALYLALAEEEDAENEPDSGDESPE